MATIMTASKQWATRPEDQRFTNLVAMRDHFDYQRQISRSAVVSSRSLQVRPTDDGRDLQLFGKAEVGYDMTNWSFNQLAQRLGAPAGFLRKLPAPIIADNLNYLARFDDLEDVGVLLTNDGGEVREMRAVTGPRYGRVWNSNVASALVNRFGDGVSGQWTVPGIRGVKLDSVTKQNTTLYASDRDMFVFLADEENRIELPNRRNGETGSLARGFFVWNSEVGSQTLGVATFLYDFVCANRIVWGAEEYKEIKIRHTASAPDRFIEEIAPALERYAHSSTAGIIEAIEDARNDKLDDVQAFLATRFGKKAFDEYDAIHMTEEGRPIETRWDVVTAVTAKARDIPYQDQRVDLERQAGELLSV